MDQPRLRSAVWKKYAKAAMKSEWLILPLVLVFLCLESCSPRIIEHTITRVDSVYVDRLKVDSIYQRDSIFFYIKADTVYHYVERWRDHYILQKDTVSVLQRDTTVITNIKEVEKELSLWQTIRIKSFWWLLGIVLGFTGWTFRKPLLGLLKKLVL